MPQLLRIFSLDVNRQNFKQLYEAWETKVEEVLKGLGFESIRHDTSVYDCSGTLDLAKKFDRIFLMLDNFDMGDIKITIIGENGQEVESLLNQLCDKLKEVVPLQPAETVAEW